MNDTHRTAKYVLLADGARDNVHENVTFKRRAHLPVPNGFAAFCVSTHPIARCLFEHRGVDRLNSIVTIRLPG